MANGVGKLICPECSTLGTHFCLPFLELPVCWRTIFILLGKLQALLVIRQSARRAERVLGGEMVCRGVGD